jgi:hypothetical protein
MLECQECGKVSTGKARAWRALLNGEPGVDEFDFVTIYCPLCAEREFGPSRREQDRTA